MKLELKKGMTLYHIRYTFASLIPRLTPTKVVQLGPSRFGVSDLRDGSIPTWFYTTTMEREGRYEGQLHPDLPSARSAIIRRLEDIQEVAEAEINRVKELTK